MTSARFLLLTMFCALALPAASRADTTLRLDGPAARGIRAAPLAPAKLRAGRISLPIRGSTAATVTHGGAIRLRAGTRTATLSKLVLRRVRTARGTIWTLSAAIGRTPARTLFRVGGTIGRRGVVIPTVTGSRALRRALGLPRTPAGRFAVLVLTRPRTSPPAPPPVTGDCAGGPAPLARPATAVDVDSAPMTWHVRESFIRYINGGQGTSVQDGATQGPPRIIAPATMALVYDFHYVFKSGWRDPGTGRARLTYSGRVNFRWKAHEIDLALTDPEIEIDGPRSRAIFCSVNLANAGEKPGRGVLANLNVTGGSMQMPATIPADTAEGVFAGYFPAGDPIGWIGVDGL